MGNLINVGRPPVLPPVQVQGPIYGNSLDKNNPDIPAVSGDNSVGGDGVYGLSVSGRGVHGQSQTFQGVYGQSNSQAGVVGESNTFDGVFGISHSAGAAGVSGHNDKGGMGGFFDAKVVINSDASVTGTLTVATLAPPPSGTLTVGGNATVTGTLQVQVDVVLLGGDCAEEFDVVGREGIEPGSVVVMNSEGVLEESRQAYDKKVTGVIAGAGDYKPGIVLDKRHSSASRLPVALLGKVYCKVDAERAPVEIGDLLTTSSTPGYAMKAQDPLRAFGAVIGKALRPLQEGRGLIPILVALQ